MSDREPDYDALEDDHGDKGHATPADLLELHEVLEYEGVIPIPDEARGHVTDVQVDG